LVEGGDADLTDPGDPGDQIGFEPAEEELEQDEDMQATVWAKHGGNLRKRRIFPQGMDEGRRGGRRVTGITGRGIGGGGSGWFPIMKWLV
jgi:hypothetical protein